MSISSAMALRGNGAARTGNARWRRLTEVRTRSAKSVFHFDVQDQWRNPPMPGFPGCTSFASDSASAPISGHSMAGTSGEALSGSGGLSVAMEP